MINHQNLIKLKLTFRKASKLLKNARLIQNRRAPKTRDENRRARAGLRKPGLQNRRAGRPGPVPIPGISYLS